MVNLLAEYSLSAQLNHLDEHKWEILAIMVIVPVVGPLVASVFVRLCFGHWPK